MTIQFRAAGSSYAPHGDKWRVALEDDFLEMGVSESLKVGIGTQMEPNEYSISNREDEVLNSTWSVQDVKVYLVSFCSVSLNFQTCQYIQYGIFWAVRYPMKSPWTPERSNGVAEIILGSMSVFAASVMLTGDVDQRHGAFGCIETCFLKFHGDKPT